MNTQQNRKVFDSLPEDLHREGFKRRAQQALVDAMHETRISKRDVADMLGLGTPETVDNWLTGYSAMPAWAIAALLPAFGPIYFQQIYGSYANLMLKRWRAKQEAEREAARQMAWVKTEYGT